MECAPAARREVRPDSLGLPQAKQPFPVTLPTAFACFYPQAAAAAAAAAAGGGFGDDGAEAGVRDYREWAAAVVISGEVSPQWPAAWAPARSTEPGHRFASHLPRLSSSGGHAQLAKYSGVSWGWWWQRRVMEEMAAHATALIATLPTPAATAKGMTEREL